MSELPEKLITISIRYWTAVGGNDWTAEEGNNYTASDLEKEIIKRYNAHNDQQAEIAKLQAEVEYYKGVADGYEQILEKQKE